MSVSLFLRISEEFHQLLLSSSAGPSHFKAVLSPSADSMGRAAIQAFRTARRLPVWRASRRPNAISFTSRQVLSSSTNPSFIPATLQSSMNLRNLSLAAVSTLVASGAWYIYQGDGLLSTPVALNGTSPSRFRGIATVHAEIPPESARRALLVENDQFFTAAINSEQPLTKKTDDSDRAVVGMLTPEQATQKLRKNEESYLVNRGKGVVRYDVVQVPSNSPIEDDHSEKIVEVPSTVAASREGNPNNDWMFWAVFDGHS